MTEPVQPLDLAPIQARFEATTHPDWRDDTDMGRVLAEVLQLRAALRVETEMLTEVTAACTATEREAADLRAELERVSKQYATLRSDAQCVAGLLREIDYYARTGKPLNYSAIRSGADALDSAKP